MGIYPQGYVENGREQFGVVQVEVEAEVVGGYLYVLSFPILFLSFVGGGYQGGYIIVQDVQNTGPQGAVGIVSGNVSAQEVGRDGQ